MHAQINPRQSNQQKHRGTDDPYYEAHTSRLDPRRQYRREGAEEDGARQ